MDRRKAIQKAGIITGAAIMMPSLSALLQSCQSKSRMDWNPLFLAKNEASLISALVDTILPRTTTPGALDMKVDIFIDRLIAETYAPNAQERLKLEMATFDQRCVADHGEEFSKLNQAKKMPY